MNASPIPTPREEPQAVRSLTFPMAIEILWTCAWEALVAAFVIQLLCGIGISLVGGLWRDMTPALPPMLAAHMKPEAEPSPVWDFLKTSLQRHQFALLFAAFFIGKGTLALARHSTSPQHRPAAAWLAQASRRVSDQWFGVVFLNAFGAFLGALLIGWAPQFSYTGWLSQFLPELCRPVITRVAGAFSGADGSSALQSLWGWYSQNQFKFTFWVLYLAAICDDLGLPNLKTLARLGWRRLHRSRPDGPGSPAVACRSPKGP